MKTFKFLACSAVLAGILATTAAQAAECGTKDRITVSAFTWLSAASLAHLAQKILVAGYGCNAEVVPGDTVPTATSMLSKGEPDIAPELWLSSVGEIWTKAKEKGIIYKAGDIFSEGGQEGWWVPDYVVKEHPEIKSITDLAANAKLFAELENPAKGRLYGCPPGWACEITTNNLFKALKLESSFELFGPGSGENLKAAVARKVARHEPFVGYYWAPTDAVGKYNLVKLGMPAFEEENWKCLTDAKCTSPKVTGWKTGEVAVAVASTLKAKAPPVAEFLSKYTIPNSTVNKVLAWADDNKATPEDVATHFLKTEEAIWTKWVPADAAEKIKASVK
jgi:glycine betaine/proline transport system substrate-binding protein